jgi:aspartyl-tRNA(Asn)/glutamyl-tRNA(Gln) amidotransferase subunit A
MSLPTLKDLHSKLKNRDVTSVSLVQNSLNKFKATDSTLHTSLSLLTDSALEQAAKIDKAYDEGKELPVLAGIPIGIKDNINIRGAKTTCASKILENFVAPFSATAIHKLESQNAIAVAKLNLDEFAMGSSTENSAFGPSKNPWNTDYVPGGSSGGSAAAVAAGIVPASLGSDTGGSIRQPAAFCGIVGLKPTYGRISRYGLVAFASSLDQIGTFTHTVEDTALMLNALCGHDPHDATSAQIPVPDFTQALKKDVKGLRFAVPKELLDDRISDDIKQAMMKALDQLKAAGASYDIISMKSFDLSIATYYIIAPAEASANLARYDGIRYTSRYADSKNLKELYTKTRGEFFGTEVKRRIILGTFALSSGYYDAYYLKAQKARTLIKNEFAQLFTKYDAIITPTTPTPAFKFGSHEDPQSMYMADLATIPGNMAGIPGLSVPSGFSTNGLPLGFQIYGKAFDEETVLTIGNAFQSMTNYHLQTPELS